MTEHEQHSLSREFLEIEALCDQGIMTLQKLLDHIRGRGEALITLVLAGPFLLPLPLPGLSIPFGILILIFGLGLSTGWQPRLPSKWMNRPVSEDMLKRFCRTARSFLKRVERFIRPRHLWMHQNLFFRGTAGIMITICGFLLALPLPPGTNAPPAAAIVCLSVSLLERDGILLLLGYVLFLLNVVLFTLIPILGYEAIIKILGLGF